MLPPRIFAQKKVAVGLVLVLVLAAGFYFFSTKHATRDTLRRMSVSAEKIYWAGEIKTVGVKAAYREFSDLWSEAEYQVKHSHGHTFGEALYGQVGLAGISACDAKSIDCLHGFMIAAIADHGLSEARRLVDQCTSKEYPYGCLHGVGHGLVTYLGLEMTGLQQALRICESAQPSFGCFTGAFMEYHESTLLLGRDSGRWQGLCDAVASEFRGMCFFSLPYVWYEQMHAAGNSLFQSYGKIADRCAALPDKTDTLSCIRGAGHNLPAAASFGSTLILDACEVFRTIANGTKECLKSAAHFETVNGGSENATQLCALAAAELRPSCIEGITAP